MARRGRDLFELLRDRGGRRASAGSSSSGTGRSRKGHGEAGFLTRLGRSARALVVGPHVAGQAGSATAGRRAAPAVPSGPMRAGQNHGMALVAVAALALLCGFFLGRVTAGAKAGTGRGDLQVDGAPAGGSEGARKGTPPAYVGEDQKAKQAQAAAPRVVPLTREQEEAQVSNLAWLLLKCPARDRARAASAAAWLRDHGLPNARIRQVAMQADGSQLWYLVLSYTTPDTQAQDLERLRSLDLPTTFDSPTNEGALSSLRDSVRGLQAPFDTSNFKRR